VTDDELKSKIDLFTNYLFDATRDSMFGYWSALLTINGVLVSVFSAIAILQSTYAVLSAIIISCSLLSSFLIIQNFHDLLASFRFQGILLDNLMKGVNALSEEEMQNQRSKSERKHNRITKRESVAVKLLFAQSILIVVLLMQRITL
jgi:hypothetical protein